MFIFNFCIILLDFFSYRRKYRYLHIKMILNWIKISASSVNTKQLNGINENLWFKKKAMQFKIFNSILIKSIYYTHLLHTIHKTNTHQFQLETITAENGIYDAWHIQKKNRISGRNKKMEKKISMGKEQNFDKWNSLDSVFGPVLDRLTKMNEFRQENVKQWFWDNDEK